ncbi:argininosuccinate synthetase, partial [Colletotrichum tropicale]
APDAPLDITVHFDKGLPVKVVTPQQTATDPVELFGLLNALGKEHGVGRIVSFRLIFVWNAANGYQDIVENRYICT